MNIEDMTPEQLREYAAEKEARKEALEAKYISDSAANVVEFKPNPVIHEPWEQPIEFEGETYWIDMHKINSLRFIRKIAEVQKDARKHGGEVDTFDALEVFDFALGDEAQHVEEVVIKAKGFDEFREIYRIKEAIFDKLDIKN